MPKAEREEIPKAEESSVLETDKLNVVILHKDSRDADEVAAPLDAKRFSFGNTSYNIKQRGIYKEVAYRLKKLPPFVKRVIYPWSIYRAGHQDPIFWEETTEDDFTAEDILALDEDDVALEGVNSAIKEEVQSKARRRKLGALKWLIILAVIAAGFGAFIIFVLPMLMGGLPIKLF